MAVINGMNHCQPLAVVAVGISAKLVFDLVCLEICQAAAFQNSILRHCRIPHQVAPSLPVIDVFQQAAHIDNGIAHDRQRHIIGNIILVGITEICFHGMA